MADVNKDGNVNAADVVFLAKMLGQKEEKSRCLPKEDWL